MTIVIWEQKELFLEIVIITSFIYIASCRTAETFEARCGLDNSCEGNVDEFVCVCNAYGYEYADGSDGNKCKQSKMTRTYPESHQIFCNVLVSSVQNIKKW